MHKTGRMLLLLSVMAIIIVYLQYNMAKNKVQKVEDTSGDVEKLPETRDPLPAQVNLLQETRELLPGLVNTLQVEETQHSEHNQLTADTDKHVEKAKEVALKPEVEKTVVKESVIEDAIVDESLPLCPVDPPKLSEFLTSITR